MQWSLRMTAEDAPPRRGVTIIPDNSNGGYSDCVIFSTKQSAVSLLKPALKILKGAALQNA